MPCLKLFSLKKFLHKRACTEDYNTSQNKFYCRKVRYIIHLLVNGFSYVLSRQVLTSGMCRCVVYLCESKSTNHKFFYFI